MLINSRQAVWLVNVKPEKGHANQDGFMHDQPELPSLFLPVSLFSVFCAEKPSRPLGNSEVPLPLPLASGFSIPVRTLLDCSGSEWNVLAFPARWSLCSFCTSFPGLSGPKKCTPRSQPLAIPSLQTEHNSWVAARIFQDRH